MHMYIQGFISYKMGYASVVALILVVCGTLVSTLMVRATGYHRMTSDSEWV